MPLPRDESLYSPVEVPGQNKFPTRPGASFFIRQRRHTFMEDKDIRFTDKKIDESWKEQASREKDRVSPSAASSKSGADQPPNPESKSQPTSAPFLNLLKSLGYQAMIHLGELPHPGSGRPEADLEAARETIDLLLALKNKTGAYASSEEMEIFQAVLPELQMKFAEKA